MTINSQFLAGCLVLALLTLSPGADMAFVTKVALRDGRRAAFASTLGIVSGLPFHAAASAIGLAAVLAASPIAFTALKLVGAGYLAFLGLRAIHDSRSQPELQAEAGARSGYVQGLLTNLLNPKVAIFYLTFVPQFIEPGASVLSTSLLFALVHALEGIVWLNAYAALLDSVGRYVRRPSVRRWLERASGVALLGVAVRVVAT